MSSISMDAPTLRINENKLQNLMSFIHTHEQLLKDFGAIKIKLNNDCKLALKKRRKPLFLCVNTEQIVKINGIEGIYFVQKSGKIDDFVEESQSITNESTFWSSLSFSSNMRRPLNISILPNKSFFTENTSRFYFDIHRLPRQSLLKLCGTKITRQFTPWARRAHGPGSIFPLRSVQQHLFSINYHHEGGAHYWYIIPDREREALSRALKQQNLPNCLEHGQVLIDPSLLDKYRIRYHRIIQYPNEFVVLYAGTLAQSFAENASWSESIAFALPSWIEDGHARVPIPFCQCNIYSHFLPEPIDISLFKPELIQKYITSHLNVSTYDKSLALKGL